MNISKPLSSTLTAVITGAFLLISGCGGGSGGGGGGGVTFPPPATSPPASAVTITVDNAEDLAASAYGVIQSLILLDDWVGSADATAITIGEIARIIKAKAQALTSVSGATGAAYGPFDCYSVGSSYSGNDTIDVGDDTEGRFAGSLTFIDCDGDPVDGPWGFTINGTVVYDYSWYANGDYSNHFGGDLTITLPGPLDMVLTGMDYADNGRFIVGAGGNFSLTLTYALSTPAGGYLMQTPTPIAGTYFDPPCALSGEALVTGAAPTKLRLTFSGGDAFTVDWSDDGSNWLSVPPSDPTGSNFDCWWYI